MTPSEGTWEVPGYDVLRLIGLGGLGQVWLAADAASGALVVLRTGFPAAEVPVLTGLGEHVVRCREACEVDGDLVLVMDHVAGGTLAGLARRLSAGQVVTALAPIAAALATAHDRGLVHGRLTAAEVLLTSEGKPVLDGLGLRGSGAPQDDVAALAEIGLQLLDPDHAGPVRDALCAAGDARVLATALLAACPAEPLLVPAARPTPRPERRRRRWPLAVPVVLAVAVAVAVALVHGQRHPPATSWSAVLAGLDATRALAFARSDVGLLEQVYVPGSGALAADAARLRVLTARQQHAQGLRHRVAGVRATGGAGGTVELEVVESLAGYEIRGPGAVRRVVPDGPELTWHLTLVRTPAGWRVRAVVA